MPVVIIHKDEPFEKALRRLKKLVTKEGIIQAIKDHRYYEKPSVKNRKRRNKRPAMPRIYERTDF
jgi:small subunit ribosomal protein S21